VAWLSAAHLWLIKNKQSPSAFTPTIQPTHARTTQPTTQPQYSVANCPDLCNKCIAAAASCLKTPNAPLPAECASYASQAASCAGSGRRLF